MSKTTKINSQSVVVETSPPINIILFWIVVIFWTVFASNLFYDWFVVWSLPA